MLIGQALTEAVERFQAADLPGAEAICRQVLQADPSQPDALHLLGLIAFQVGRADLGIEYVQRALAVVPTNPAALCNLALMFQAGGKLEDASGCYHKALRLQPISADAHNGLGNIRASQGKLDEAIGHYECAIRCRPDFADAYNNLGYVLLRQGRSVQAEQQFRRALELRPQYVEAWDNLGNALREQERLDEAVQSYREALRLRPTFAQAHNNLGGTLLLQGNHDDAVESCRQALALAPNYADAHTNLAAGLRRLAKLDEAEAHFRQALALRPDLDKARLDLAEVLKDQCKAIELAKCLEEPLALRPTDELRIASALILPAVYESLADLESWRHRLVQKIGELRQCGVAMDIREEQATPLFYLAYQGFNDSDIQRDAAQLYRPPLDANVHGKPRNTCKKRIGFVSTFFRSHTIGHWTRGIVAQLSREDFEVVVLSVGSQQDEVSAFLQHHADRFIEVPKELPAARRLIAEQQLDLLLYADIGMDPFTYTLAFSRLAPVQCVTLGHPDTSGIEAIDYYISAEALETEDAQDYYTEKLIRLKSLPVYYYKPPMPAKADRQEFGLAESDHVYVCLQTLYKFHPCFDEVLGGILRTDPRGILILSQGSLPHLEALLRIRFAGSLGDLLERIRFQPVHGYQKYRQLLATADVQLDPLPFGGGNTSYDGLTLGIPIVTLPSQFLRGRITYALYKQMEMLDCVTASREEYVQMAVRLGCDRDFRQAMRDKILSQNGVLFENRAGVRDLEQFFRGAIQAAAEGQLLT